MSMAELLSCKTPTHIRTSSHWRRVDTNLMVCLLCHIFYSLMVIPQNYVDATAAIDPNEIHPDRNTQSNAGDKKRSNWKSTASSTAKLLLRGVRDTADAFGPLKSVAGGLCFILENCEVHLISCAVVSNTYRFSAYKGKQTNH